MSAPRIALVSTAEPIVTVEEARTQLRLDQAETDATIERWISSATRWAENWCGRRLAAGDYIATFDDFPCGYSFRLPHHPVSAVTALNYLDGDGAATLWEAENYVVSDLDAGFAPLISLATGVEWPTTYARGGAVTVEFTAETPPEAKDAILLMAGALDNVRANQMVEGGGSLINTMAAENLLSPYRIWAV